MFKKDEILAAQVSDVCKWMHVNSALIFCGHWASLNITEMQSENIAVYLGRFHNFSRIWLKDIIPV